jgi:hypothetical protein
MRRLRRVLANALNMLSVLAHNHSSRILTIQAGSAFRARTQPVYTDACFMKTPLQSGGHTGRAAELYSIIARILLAGIQLDSEEA